MTYTIYLKHGDNRVVLDNLDFETIQCIADQVFAETFFKESK